jgi:uncharacterized protein (DUF1778 family)
MAHATKPLATSRRGIVNLRMSREDRNIIDSAAQMAGKTRAKFMIDAARRAARQTLLDTTLVLVDGGTFERFKRLFDAPPRPSDRLRELVSQTAPWER